MTAVIGHARVSTADQDPQLQIDAPQAAGCSRIIEERASGASRGRPELARLLHGLRRGDTVVVWKLDRVARSLLHLLEIIERIRQAGVSFRCLTSPIDTASPTGTLTLQILGAVAEFERALMIERTRAGLQAAKSRGRVGGNPRLKAGDRQAIALASQRRKAVFLDQVRHRLDDWRQIALLHRPGESWDAILKLINEPLPEDRCFNRRTLLRHVRAAVAEGFVDPALLHRSKPEGTWRRIQRHPAYAAILVALRRPTRPTLREIASDLEAAGIRTSRGAKTWPLSSVSDLADRVSAVSESRMSHPFLSSLFR